MDIIKSNFGQIEDSLIFKYKLLNDTGSYVCLINYGGIITDIFVPDRYGNLENVVIGLDNLEGYIDNAAYFGATVGRVGGRISNASFKIEALEYKLEENNNKNNLHGGNKGLSRVVFNAKEVREESSVGVELSYFSKDMENGFPGNMNISVLFTFDNENNLVISYTGDTDKKTITTMTNHSYFNLSGDYKEDILSQDLFINSNNVIELDSELIPTGNILDVEGTPFDFRIPKMVGKDINTENTQLMYGNGYDHPFILNEGEEIAASLYHKVSGRLLQISTDQKCVVLYTGNSISNDYILYNGKKSSDRLALCLETQYYPDAINQDFPSQILIPGEIYTGKTTYSFKVLK